MGLIGKDIVSTEVHCSFCGKAQTDVAQLVAGPSAFICNECVSICNEIIESAKQGTIPKPQPLTRQVKAHLKGLF